MSLKNLYRELMVAGGFHAMPDLKPDAVGPGEKILCDAAWLNSL